MSPSPTRTAVLLVLVSLTAGCLAGTPGGDVTTSPTPEATPTYGGHQSAATQPDPDKSVTLVNDWNRSVEMHVEVVREATDETVYDATHQLEPGAERTVYDTAAADPDGVESFTVVVTARNETERVTVETNKCYGDAYGTIREDGSLYLYYAIC